MAPRWQNIRGILYAPVAVAIALVWLAAVLRMTIGDVAVRASALGGFIDSQIDKLPSALARSAYTTLSLLFLLGWIVPLSLGIKRLFHRAEP